jgi:hypothetical protein
MILILHAELLEMHEQILLTLKHSQATENHEVKQQYTTSKPSESSESLQNQTQLALGSCIIRITVTGD